MQLTIPLGELAMTAQLPTKSPTNFLIIFGETVDLILSLHIEGQKPWKEAAATDEELAIKPL